MKLFLFLLAGLQAMTLTALAHTHLHILSEPGVDIYLNDEFFSTTKWKSNGLHLKLSAGDYRLEARKPGFAKQTKTVSLKKGDVEVWELATFTPEPGRAKDKKEPRPTAAAAYGALTVYTHPTECTITLVTAAQNEASWPKTDKRWTAQKLPAGKYTVKAIREGRTLSYDLEVPGNGQVEVIFDFRRERAHLYNVTALKN